MCFFHLDRVWTSTNAVRADFGKIMSEYNVSIDFAIWTKCIYMYMSTNISYLTLLVVFILCDIAAELKAVLSRSLNHGPDSLDAFASAAGMEGLQFQE